MDGNLMEQFRERRKALSESRETYISIPGYSEIGLACKYRLLDGKELNEIVKKVRKQYQDEVDRGIFTAIDTMLAASLGLYIQQNGDFVSLDPEGRGEPYGYEPALATFIGDPEADTGRKVVISLFGGNDAALAMHNFKLNRWFQDTTRDANEELLGEV